MMHSPMRLKISQWLWHSFRSASSQAAHPRRKTACRPADSGNHILPRSGFPRRRRAEYPPPLHGRLLFFIRQKAHLAVPVPGVCIALDAPVFHQLRRFHLVLCRSPFSLIQIPMIFPISFVSSSFRTAVISSADTGHQVVLCHILRPLKAVFHRLF